MNMTITSTELRQKYLEFFKSKQHAIIPSASLIPENDPTVLFTTAGMHPLTPYLMGETHPQGTRLVNTQKCIRTGDIDEVGDLSHLTFFEMLGNWSLNDYFKKESIAWAWEFVTSKDGLAMEKEKLAVTVFGGDNNYPNLTMDQESFDIWLGLDVPENRIAPIKGGVIECEDNWWGPAGQTGPCGPSTEIYYWVGESEFPPEDSNPKNDAKNWLEIWNVVLMQFNKTLDNKFEPLKQKNIDTGMGLERTLVVLNQFHDVYRVDTLWPLIQEIEEISGREYIENIKVTLAMRIITDHVRAAVMIMGDQRGVAPSNTDQGYIVRRLIRRAVRQGHVLNIKENFCSTLARKTIEIFKEAYPEIGKKQEFILTEIAKEESKFRNTLEKGIKKFNSLESVSGKQAFDLYQSYGFPLEMTLELAKEEGIEVDINEFEQKMKKHQELSRLGAQEKFKGGLADASEMSKKYHTATHLLHSALRKVLGGHVEQKGSNITAERLRFDFSHPEKLTDEQKQQVQDIVNQAIAKNYQITCREMTVEEAKQDGAIGLFEDKYEGKVKVYTVGNQAEIFSKEICGGPHVENTGDLGEFIIKKEQASSAGVRRIKAVLN
ncbi:MAG: alanine--tRNA ligase [bacterium]